MTEVKPKNLS